MAIYLTASTQNFATEANTNVKIYVGPQVRQESNKRPRSVMQTFRVEKFFIEYDSAWNGVTTAMHSKIRDISRRLMPHCSHCYFQLHVTSVYCCIVLT